jgi:hypothetical protein
MTLEIACTIGILIAMNILFTWMILFPALMKVKGVYRWAMFMKVTLYGAIALVLASLIHIAWYNSALWAMWVIGSQILLGYWRQSLSARSLLVVVLLGFGLAYLMELLRSTSESVYFLWIGFVGGACMVYIGIWHILIILSQSIQLLE